MINDRLQISVGLAVVTSDTIDIPDYSDNVVSSLNTSVVANKLVDSTQNFNALNIKAGFIIYNNTTMQVATVTAVDSDTVLSISADIFTSVGDSFNIYKNGNGDGALLYVGTGGDLKLKLLGGGEAMFRNVNDGQFMPIKAKRVFSTGTTASDIVALW